MPRMLPMIKKERRSWCKKPGHLKKDCLAWKRRQENGGGKVVNLAESVGDEEVSEALNVIEGKDSGCWIMDSGCSFHMSPNLEWFDSIVETTGSVVLGNNQVCSIRGIGSVRLKVEK